MGFIVSREMALKITVSQDFAVIFTGYRELSTGSVIVSREMALKILVSQDFGIMFTGY